MRKYILFCLGLAFGLTLSAQEKLYIYKTDKTTSEIIISKIDSIYFSADGAKAYIKTIDLLSEYTAGALKIRTYYRINHTVVL